MISPTGGGSRGQDAWGSGRYLAPRGSKLHQGVDYVCTPDQPIVSPIHGQIIREARPYAGDDYSGVLIQGPRIAVKLFYMKPHRNLIGHMVEQGQEIGTAQDISKKYGHEMTPHVHLEIVSVDPEVFIKWF